MRNAAEIVRVAIWMLLAVLGLGMKVQGQEPVRWSATDVKGVAVKVPAERKATVLVFVLPEQPQSQAVLEQLKGALGAADVQVALVVSGKEAEAGAKKLLETGKIEWPVIADTEYAGSGRMSVHVWPTTVVVGADGRQVAHLAGVPRSYAKDLESYLANAAGKIDAAELQRRLESRDTVVDSPGQMAERHLAVARRLLEKDLADQARVELERGLKLEPEHVGLQMAMVEVLLGMREGAAAMQLLEKMDEKAVSPARIKVLRGRALVGMGKWDEAEGVLIGAAMLNPDPAEAYYELGRVYQHQEKWQQAAETFRRAFETTARGKRVAATGPTTRP